MDLRILLALLACALCGAACTTLKPIEATPDEVQSKLLTETIVQPGDRIRVVTSDGSVHKFRVTEIDHEQGLVLGKDQRIVVKEIVAVETREISMGRSSALAGGIGIGMMAIIAIAIAPAALLAGG